MEEVFETCDVGKSRNRHNNFEKTLQLRVNELCVYEHRSITSRTVKKIHTFWISSTEKQPLNYHIICYVKTGYLSESWNLTTATKSTGKMTGCTSKLVHFKMGSGGGGGGGGRSYDARGMPPHQFCSRKMRTPPLEGWEHTKPSACTVKSVLKPSQ